MTNKGYCPACYGELEVIELAPCARCGWDKNEIAHFGVGKHIYSEFEVYGTELVLCNFCDVDLSSEDSEYWGFSPKKRLGYGSPEFRKLRDIPIEDLRINKGLFCPACGQTKKYLEAVCKSREANRTA